MLTKKIRRSLIGYLALTIFCWLFSYVYESFSHHVCSDFMLWFFLVPLSLGVLPNILALIKERFFFSSSWQRIIHNFSIATLIVACILQGVFEIYGTTSPYTVCFFIVGFSLLASSILLWGIQNVSPK